jgi:predicted metalloprotease with PDZ domain
MLLCCFASVVSARQVRVIIQPPVDSHARAFIEVVSDPVRIWSFPNSYAGVSELGSRIERLEAFDTDGAEISVRKIAPGQFEAARSASRFRYEVNLAPPEQPSDDARVSWLDPARGLLMLADLLPTEVRKAADGEKKDKAAQSAMIRVTVPVSWAVYSNEGQNAAEDSTVIARNEVQKELTFVVPDVGRAVFAVGSQLRSLQMSASGMTLRLVADGEWAFADSDALEMAGNVLKAHREVFGAMPSKQGTLILIPFPQTVAASKWSAETRGSTVALLMGKLPSKTAALSQLSVPLTHELFHLWVPNALALDGEYDWFYEGFTVYQAARTAIRLGLLTFQEFLNAIARAYDAYSAGVDHDRWSLVEASHRRWLSGESVVYQKSLLVAFLYDLKLRSLSRGKRSLDDVYRELFRQHRSAEGSAAEAGRRSDGNAAAIAALSDAPGMQSFAESLIRRAVAIDLPAHLAPSGLSVERLGLRTRVSVSESLTRSQRDLLRELGYNDGARSSRQGKHD